MAASLDWHQVVDTQAAGRVGTEARLVAGEAAAPVGNFSKRLVVGDSMAV